MNASGSTPLLVPLVELDVAITLDVLYAQFRAQYRIREIWEKGLLSDEAFRNRGKFLHILHKQMELT